VKKGPEAKALFLDIGGVLLSDGWGRVSRKLAAESFNLDAQELDDRHHQAFATYELGKLTLNEYLDRVVFHEPRSFTHDVFWQFMCAQSTAMPEVLEMFRMLKAIHRLKVVAVSNEARELNAYRIQAFNLTDLVDCFVSSCFVHLRKPDADMFRLALDISQVTPEQVVFVENTEMFVQIAEDLGIPSVFHTDYESTRAKLAAFGLDY
jgi:putative hydrolase of the HAD superfamily